MQFRYIVNLAENWENFKAAKLALNNTLQATNLKQFSSTYGQKVPELLKITSNLLKEGNITGDTLLKDINGIVNTLRECNVAVRWLILHTVLKPGKYHIILYWHSDCNFFLRYDRQKQKTEAIQRPSNSRIELRTIVLIQTPSEHRPVRAGDQGPLPQFDVRKRHPMGAFKREQSQKFSRTLRSV